MALNIFRRNKNAAFDPKAERRVWWRALPLGTLSIVAIMVIPTVAIAFGMNAYFDMVKKNQILNAEAQKQADSYLTPGNVAVGPIQNPPAQTMWSPSFASSFDPTMLLFIAGGVVVVGAALFIFVPRIKSALRKRRERKALKATHAATWTELFARRDNLITTWSKYETDVALMIDYPIMTDYTDPVVNKVIVAMQKVRNAAVATSDTSSVSAEGSTLHQAVDEFEIAFNAAEKYARRFGQTKLDAREQRKLSTARQALNIILDKQAPAYEVEAAYRSLRSSLKGIIDLPQSTIAELESLSRRELTVNTKEVEFAK